MVDSCPYTSTFSPSPRHHHHPTTTAPAATSPARGAASPPRAIAAPPRALRPSPPRPAARRLTLEATRAFASTAETAAAASAVAAADTSAAASDTPPAATQPVDDNNESLPAFLSWAAANGVTGIAGEAPTVGLYADGGGRGVLACADVGEGGVLFSVPARLLLVAPAPACAHADLAAVLLGHVAVGEASPWHPYVASLPRPPARSAVGGGLPAEAAGLLVCPAARAAFAAAAAAPDADYDAATSPIACDRSTYRWARAMAASRSVGFASPTGGLAARALCPLLDMVNHAGLEAELLLSGPAAPSANAEWVAVPGDDGLIARVDVLATRPIAAGEEVTFSYGDRANADFLAHWGFVPARNAADGVALFGSVEEATTWAAARVPLDGAPVRPAPAFTPSPDPVMLFPGGSVDSRLAAALAAVGGDGYARRVVAARAADILSASPAPPLLPLLGELARADEEERAYWVALQRRYSARAADVSAGGGDPAAGGAPPPPPRGVPRAAWRDARLLALQASAYSLMILWDCLATVGVGNKAAAGEG